MSGPLLTKSHQSSVRGDVFFYNVLEGEEWWGSGVKKIKTISQKVFNMRSGPHTHTVSAILLNTQRNLFSQTHTHTRFLETADVSTGNSWQATGGKGTASLTLYIPSTPNTQPLFFSSWIFYTSNQTHTHRHTCLYRTGTVINPSSTAAYLFLMVASPSPSLFLSVSSAQRISLFCLSLW